MLRNAEGEVSESEGNSNDCMLDWFLISVHLDMNSLKPDELFVMINEMLREEASSSKIR